MKPVIKTFTFSLITLGVIIGVSSCDSPTPEEGGSLTSQSAQLNVVAAGVSSVANPYKTTNVVLSDPGILETKNTFTITLLKPAETETKAMVAVSESEAKRYQEINGTSYPILPSAMVNIPASISIAAGSTVSEPFVVTTTLNESIPMNTPYLFAIKLVGVDGSTIQSPNDVALFTVERYQETPQVVKAVRLTRLQFLSPVKQFTSIQGDFTMETLVYVEKFRSDADPGDAQISTLMGVEGGTLLRFGDSGVPGNHLQANGTHIDYTFQPDRWYHIAYVYGGGNVTVYVNGQSVSSFRKNSALYGGNPWYIARSWNGNRGLQGRLAETRIWNSARTQSQIQDNMFIVDPKSDDLVAYWKMNVASGNTITDQTGHGYDLKQFDQDNDTKAVDVTVLALEEPVSIE